MPETFFSLAPTDEDAATNRLRDPFRPVAAWQLADHHFRFDSSLLLPSMAEDLVELVALCRMLPGCPMTIYGHADPAGEEGYNKLLSGRRATALYALLTRQADLFDYLATHPLGADDWGKSDIATATMRQHLDQTGDPAGQSVTKTQLYRRYMDAVCRDEANSPFEIPAGAFLGHGKDSLGKGDYHGCSEFNPVVVFSAAEAERYQQPSQTAARNEANAPNRRVTVFFFPEGTEIDLDRWPCPRANEGVKACRKRFWSDAKVRLANGPGHREYPTAPDTFGCRFYDRLELDAAPKSRRTVIVQLHDPVLDPVPNTSVSVEAGAGRTIETTTDSQGWIHCQVATEVAQVVVRYTPPSTGVEYRVTLNLPPLDRTDERYLGHIRNFGFGDPTDPERQVILKFQASEKTIRLTGLIDEPTKLAVDRRLATTLRHDPSPPP